MGTAMDDEVASDAPRRQLSCECSVELYTLVRERAAAAGDSMAGVLRSAVVEFLVSESDVIGALNGRGGKRSSSAAPELASASGRKMPGLPESDDLPAVVDVIASSMAAVMKSALVEFLMGAPDPLKAVCKTSGSEVGDGLWVMAEFLRLYADWSPDSTSRADTPKVPGGADSV